MSRKRLTSDIFISALVRNAEVAGANAYVIRRGSPEAGAIFIAVYDAEDRNYRLYQPAMQTETIDDDPGIGGRKFQLRDVLENSMMLSDFQSREARFDNDFWLVELERVPDKLDALFTLIEE